MHPKTVTDPSINRARRGVTSSIRLTIDSDIETTDKLEFHGINLSRSILVTSSRGSLASMSATSRA